jgi:hypothetical protein
MKKTILLFIFMLSVSTGISQVKNISINWTSGAYEVQKPKGYQSQKEVNRTKDISQSIRVVQDTLLFVAQWEDNGVADPSSLIITNIKYAPLLDVDLRGIDRDIIAAGPEFSIKNASARDELYTRISLVPVVRVGGVLKK